MTNPVIARLEGVTHRYGKTFALNDLTLDIPAQCMVGMIGPDGVGTTSIFSAACSARAQPSGAGASTNSCWPRGSTRLQLDHAASSQAA